jgi:hypothetical protein
LTAITDMAPKMPLSAIGVPLHQWAHLEGKYRPGHRADRDQHPHRLRPAPRQAQCHLIRSAEADELSQQYDGRQRDAQASQDDVKPERGRHLRTGRNHLPVHLQAGHQDQVGGQHRVSRWWSGRR